MINKENISIEWINEVAKTNKATDKILVEKLIRALLLLEGLVLQKTPFIFKGGTALMLHLDSSKRLSIDIDIIISKQIDNLEEQLRITAEKQNFNKIEPQYRDSVSRIKKEHYKFLYSPLYKTNKEEEYILLDILFEKNQYQNIIEIPIQSKFIPTIGENILVKIPSIEDLLGDKLTAFAPNTTGIPYFKKEDSMSMEIIKQLYDIDSLFDRAHNLKIVKETFSLFAKTELLYRNEKKTPEDVLEDIYQTALCIATRGIDGNGNFKELSAGIKRVSGFIFSENYHVEKAILSASKAAYLSTLISHNHDTIEKYVNPFQMKDWTISEPMNTKLNKLKKSNPEAFFYWYKILEIKTNG
ncbi:MAG: nucleotidyl transferase AbiEii/AbiGii toxin family protein [Bacteroidales bacterium]|nr:nucleotidyl transferase AbiEii/AbiGii toxin family protein [Bacteroidales bacterium]